MVPAAARLGYVPSWKAGLNHWISSSTQKPPNAHQAHDIDPQKISHSSISRTLTMIASTWSHVKAVDSPDATQHEVSGPLRSVATTAIKTEHWLAYTHEPDRLAKPVALPVISP